MSKVKSLEKEETIKEPQVEQQQQVVEPIPIHPHQLNGFAQILEVILVNDDRLKPIMEHLGALIKSAVEHNEKSKQQ